MAMTLRAGLSWRSPPRLSRYRTVFPEEAGSGLAPARAAKAASCRSLPGYAHATSIVAAVTGPIPVSFVSSAAGLCSFRFDSCLSFWRISAWACRTRCAQRLASVRAVAKLRGSFLLRQDVIWLRIFSPSARRASMPQSMVRSNAVRALTALVRSRANSSLAVNKICSAVRMSL